MEDPHTAQSMRRQFGTWDACALGVMTGSAWPLFGGPKVVMLTFFCAAQETSLYNGGPPGVIYELVAVCLVYFSITACVAELASAMPTSAGVYYWATVTGGRKWGRVLGFYAGWYNAFAYIFATVATSSISAVQLVQMYALFRPDYVSQPWHVLLAYFGCSWISCAIVIFGHRFMARINDVGLVLILAGVLVTIVVCCVMPAVHGAGYSSNRSVWVEWENDTGYESNGLVFLMGMLNGAFAFGVPGPRTDVKIDCISHIAEEATKTFAYLIAIFYAAKDVGAVAAMAYLFPISPIYQQATQSVGGTLGLSLLIFLPSFWAIVGGYVTAGRVVWTLGRGNAVPFAGTLGRISPTLHNPVNAALCVAVLNTLIGLIYLGSKTALSAFATSVVCLNLLAYLAAMLPHLLSGRQGLLPGVFWMRGWVGATVYGVACAFIGFFLVIFNFPYSQPVTAGSMNYTSAVLVGLSIVITACWIWKRRQGYVVSEAFVEEPSLVNEWEEQHGENRDKEQA
ncbi:amino acid permease [Trichoderma gamsii]|uniref:Amino acid permease n=1 Tax=Trichoderma gamsii TaxID=398673 RepID=A0A2P4ZWZ3_9HYPO|nr:amino acid permease [Trichoderma gamsii]PON28798.1 amino acid permease [Trichoderma gamsii]